MGKPIKIAIIANGTQAKGEFAGVGASGSKMGAAVKKGAAVAAAGLLVIGAGAVKLGVDATRAASDAEQSIGASETVFGKYADTVIKRSKEASTALGVSANEYRELTNVSGALLSGAGLPLKKVTGLTEDLTKRASDLAATFGGETKDAVEAVSSLLKGEADPIEKYGISIKQSDVNARLAAKGLDKLTGSGLKQAEMNARVELLMGKSAKTAGAFARETDTLAHKQQVANAKFVDAKAKLGGLLIPIAGKATDVFADELVPALESATDWLDRNQDAIIGAGKAVGDRLLPPLQTLGGIAKSTGGFMGELPPPVKRFAIEAGVAALVLPRLNALVDATGVSAGGTAAKVKQFAAEMTYAETRSAALKGGLGKMAGAAKAAAGVGGLMLLTEAATGTNDALGVLESAGGGALLGFSLGGPIGAAIGGSAGALFKLAQNTLSANDAMNAGKKPATDYASTLDDITGAATEATKALVMKQVVESRAATDAKTLGIPLRTVVSATLGQKDAIDAVSAAMKASQSWGVQYVDALGRIQTAHFDSKKAAKDFSNEVGSSIGIQKLSALESDALTSFIGKESTAWKDQTRAKREEIRATKDLTGLQKTIPKNIVTKIEAKGVIPTTRGIARVANQYKLSPKQVVTLIKVTGAETSKKEVIKVQGKLKEAAKTKADAKVTANTKQAEGSVKGFLKSLDKIRTVKVGEPNIKDPVRRAAGDAKNVASSESPAIGTAFDAGMVVGINSGSGSVAAAAKALVRNTLAAGRAEAKIHSPSRETTKDGKNLVLGWVSGIKKNGSQVPKAVRDLMKSVLAESRDGTKALQGVVGKAYDAQAAQELAAYKKAHKGKAKKIAAFEKAQKKERARVLKSTKDESAALAAVGAKQAALATGNYTKYLSKSSSLYKAMTRAGVKNLQDARNNLVAAQQALADYKAAVTAGVMQSASLGKLGEGTGFGTVAQLIARRKALAGEAKQWQTTIDALTKAGLNKADLDELIQMGPEAGMGTAKAILAGGESAVSELNLVQADLAKTAKAMGQSTAVTMKQAGVDAAQGLVNGLTAKSKQLDKAAKKLAKVLIRAFKKEMDSNSPSRKMIKEGKNTTDGVVIGLDAKRVEKASRDLARSVLTGYGTPTLPAATLTATRATAATTAAPIVIRLELTGQQLDQITRGRMYQADISAAANSGGRARA